MEPGAVFFARADRGRRCFRLGFSSIPAERIGEGIRRLAAAVWDCERPAGGAA